MSKPGVYEDLTGKQFGDLVVLGLNEEETEKTKIKYNKRMLTWNCQCSKCGNLSTKHGCDLKKYIRKNQSGCVRCHGIWLVGQKFGRLTVIEDLGCDEKSDRKLRCKCDCGNEVIVSQILLRTGNTQSCGCLQSELIAQRNKETGCWNGDSTNPKYERLYRIWGAMRNRCDSPLNIHYNLYGGKGIKVCDEWYDWFIFKDWALSHGYQDDLMAMVIMNLQTVDGQLLQNKQIMFLRISFLHIKGALKRLHNGVMSLILIILEQKQD